MDDGESLSSSLERLKRKALDSFPVVKMFDRCNLAGKGALDGFLAYRLQMSLIEVVSQSGQQYSSLLWAMLV